MVENRPWLTVLCHVVLILGIGVVVLPLWVAIVASTHAGGDLLTAPIPMWFGGHAVENYTQMLNAGMQHVSGQPLTLMLFNSLVMALTIAIGKIAIRSEEHTSELQSLMRTSYAVFCLKKKNNHRSHQP